MDRVKALAVQRRAENFPVAGWLTPAALRPAVLALYAFARIADDIADDADLAAVDRLARLDAMKASLGPGPMAAPPGAGAAVAAAMALYRELSLLGVDHAPARDFLLALGIEATLARVPDRDALIKISRMTAAPIGRMMTAVYGVADATLLRAGEDLATALQLLDHIQDCGEDYCRLDRVYLPEDWLCQAGGEAQALSRGRADRALRAVLDRVLDEADGLLAAAAPLARDPSPRALCRMAGIMLALAGALSSRLRARDPLAGRVRLGPWGRFRAVAGWALGLNRR